MNPLPNCFFTLTHCFLQVLSPLSLRNMLSFMRNTHVFRNLFPSKKLGSWKWEDSSACKFHQAPPLYPLLLLLLYYSLRCRSQQKIADMKQVSQIMKESVWKDDKEITECQHCESAFNVAKRKVKIDNGRRIDFLQISCSTTAETVEGFTVATARTIQCN